MAGELIVRGGRVIDPGRGIDSVRDVAFAAGKVADAAGPDARVFDATVASRR